MSADAAAAAAPAASAAAVPPVNCVVDRSVLNADTYPSLTDLGLSVFAPLCGRNRGAFVLTPSDGHTYGCVAFPPSFATIAGVPAVAAAGSSDNINATVDTNNNDINAAVDTNSNSTNATVDTNNNSTNATVDTNNNSTNAAVDTNSASLSSPSSPASTVLIKDSNAIDKAYKNGTITAAEAVDLVDLYVQSVFFSSGTGVTTDTHGCDVNGLAELVCDRRGKKSEYMPDKIRAATLAGVLSPAPWATNGSVLSVPQAETFYTAEDFSDMSDLGLNAVQIPAPMSIFAAAAAAAAAAAPTSNETTTAKNKTKLDSLADEVVKEGIKELLGAPAAAASDSAPTAEVEAKLALLDRLAGMAADRGMGVILQLVDDVSDDGQGDTADATVRSVHGAAKLMASSSKGVQALRGLILPSADLVAAARAESTTLPLFLEAGEADLPHLPETDDPNLFVALDRDHITSVADVASSDSPGDRLKMFYHESMSCQSRSPMQYAACYKNMPAYVFHGFNIAIDDCIRMGDAALFRDYGQCGRLEETIQSNWWHRHRASYAARQLAAYESGGLGWTFDAWKLFDDGGAEGSGENGTATSSTSVGALDRYAKLLALKDVVAAGLLPTLNRTDHASACLNGPDPDFVLGDRTLAPAPPPPPDCGNGWWNATGQKCDYWVPPPPTPAPTPCPAAPDCTNEGDFWSPVTGQCENFPEPAHIPKTTLIVWGAVGILIGLIVGLGLGKLFGIYGRRDGYTSVPNASLNV